MNPTTTHRAASPICREMAMSKQPKSPPSFAALVQAYFAEYLTQQRALSAQTIAAYRDAFVLFLGFAESHLGRSPS